VPLFTKARCFFRNLLSSDNVDRDLDREVRSYLKLLIEEKIRGGLPRDEAERAARLELGGIEQVKEQVRDQRFGNWLRSLLSDCRYGLRQLRKNPGFSAIAVLTLALGIGANTAIFSVVDAMLLRPLPFAEPERLVRVWESSLRYDSPRNVVNPFNFLDWREQSHCFASMAAIAAQVANIRTQGQPVAVDAMQVSPEFFSVLQVVPYLGRGFVTAEGIPGQDRSVILSYELWQRNFGADPTMIGKEIEVDGVPHVVVGVIPKGFSYPNLNAQVWTPLAMARTDDWRSGRYLTVVARLRAGVSLTQAQQDMQRVAELTAQARPDFNKNWSANVVPMLEDATRKVRQPLWVLLIAVGLLLLIACANVANLLLMHGATRLREMAVRTALGAPRLRIVQQLLAESLLLCLAGMVLALAFAHFGLSALLALIPESSPLPRSEPITIDARVLLFTLAVSSLTTVLFGLVPAIRLSFIDAQTALRKGTLRTGVTGHRSLRRAFVIAEVALALLLSVGAGLMMRSLARLTAVDPGFHPEHVLTLHIWTSPARYSDSLKRSQYVDQILAEIRGTPGVLAAGSTHFLPLTDRVSGSCFSTMDQPPPTPAEAPSAQFLIISKGYFQAMGTPLLSGRDFAKGDTFDSRPVAIVNRAFVEKYLTGKQVLGNQLHVCWTIEKPVEIVGVVADARQAQLQDAPEPTIFLNNSQAPMYFATIVVRSDGDSRLFARPAEAAIHRVDPDQAVSDVRSMESVFSDSVASPRFQAVLLLVFSALAVALAAIGIYGVISYSVSQRTNEIGIRVALGARAADVFRMVLREVVVLCTIALSTGLLGAVVLGRLMRSLLFEITPTDPTTLTVVAALLLIVSLFAAAIPARRATRVDPLVALRYE
jgi:predicted permease